VERLQRIVEGRTCAAPLEMKGLSQQEHLLAELEAEGLIRNLLPEERARAAERDALPQEEKRAHIQFVRSLVLQPPLSQIIIENRRLWAFAASTRIIWSCTWDS